MQFLRVKGDTLIARAILLKCLLERAHTLADLSERSGLHSQTVRNYLLALQTQGLLEVMMGLDGAHALYRLRATLWSEVPHGANTRG